MTTMLELKVLFSAVDKFVRPVKGITAAARDASKALSENTARMRDLDRTVAQIDSFKKLERDAAITANAFAGTRKKIDELKASMASAGAPTKAMSDEMTRLGKVSDDLKQKHQSLSVAQQAAFGKLKQAGLDTRDLAAARMKLASASAEATNASAKLQSALEAENRKMQRLRAAQADLAKSKAAASKMTGTGTKLMAGGAAIGAATAIPVAAYAVAEDAQTQLKIAMMQKGGKVADSFAEIDALATKLGNKLPGTTADFQNMMTMLIRQGMSAKSVLGGLGEATAYLGVQLKMTPEASAEFASKLQDATRTTDKDMMGLMDTIQKTFYLGVDQNNMLEGFAKLSPALSILKKEGLEAANALAPLLVMADQAGMKGEAAGNAFRKIFQQALDAKKMAKGNAELKGTGIKLNFTDGKGEFGGMEKMYAQLEQLRTVNSVQRLAALKKMFGDDAETLQALTLMIEKGASGYAETQRKLEGQAKLQERVNAQLSTLKSLWDAASGTFTNALVAFGEAISPELHAAAEWMGKMAERTQSWAKSHPELAAGIMTSVKYLGLFLLAAGGVVLGIGAILGPLAMAKFALVTLGITGAGTGTLLTGALGMVGNAIAFVARALLLNPIGLTITAIATGAYLIYQYWEPIKAFFVGLWGGISTVFKLGWAEIKGVFAGMTGYFGSIGTAIVDGIWTSLSTGWANLVQKISGLSALLPQAVKNVLGIKSPSRVFAEIGTHTMAGLEQGLQAGETGPMNAVTSAAKKLAGIGSGVALGISAAMAGVPDTLQVKAPDLGAQSAWADKYPDLPALSMPSVPTLGLPKMPDGMQIKAPDPRSMSLQAPKFPEMTGISLPSIVMPKAPMLGLPTIPEALQVRLPAWPKMEALHGKAPAIDPNLRDLFGSAGNENPVKIDSAPPIKSPSPAQSTGDRHQPAAGNTYQISITAAPGTDNQGLAALVAREIERIESQKAARSRSRLRDQE